MDLNWKYVGWAVATLLLLHTWGYMKGDFGPELWALKPERPWVLRKLVYVLVWPLRLLGSMLSSLAATAIWALMIGLGYYFVAMMRG